MAEATNKAGDLQALAGSFLAYAVEYFALLQRHTTDVPDYRAHSQAFSLLFVLQRNPSQPMSQFAATLGIPKQQLNKLVHDLEKKGCVMRRVNPADRRQTLLDITEQGERFLERVCEDLLRVIREAVSQFPEEEWPRIAESVRCLSDCFRRDALRAVTLSVTETPEPGDALALHD